MITENEFVYAIEWAKQNERLILPHGLLPGESYSGVQAEDFNHIYSTKKKWNSYQWNPPEFIEVNDGPLRYLVEQYSVFDSSASNKPTYDDILLWVRYGRLTIFEWASGHINPNPLLGIKDELSYIAEKEALISSKEIAQAAETKIRSKLNAVRDIANDLNGGLESSVTNIEKLEAREAAVILWNNLAKKIKKDFALAVKRIKEN